MKTSNKKDAFLILRIPKELKEELLDEARTLQLTLSNYIRTLIQQRVNKKNGK